MSTPVLAVLALAIIVSCGQSLAIRGSRLVQVDLLPERMSRRVRRLRSNNTRVQLGCALGVVLACGMQIGLAIH